MDKPEECIKLFYKGLNPREIANGLEMSIGSVMNNLYRKVGEGHIKRSDILLSIDNVTRLDFEEIIDQVLEQVNKPSKQPEDGLEGILHDCWCKPTKDDLFQFELEGNIICSSKYDSKRFCSHVIQYLDGAKDIDMELFKIYFELRMLDVWVGDLYLDLFIIENQLHCLIENILMKYYGFDDSKWWRSIPENIRVDCQIRREKDQNPEEKPYMYTNLIDLNKIIKSEWEIFSPFFQKTFGGGKSLDSAFNKLNTIRNKVMHPIKRKLSVEDFSYVHEFLTDLQNGISKSKEKVW